MKQNKILNELRNVIGDFLVEDIAPGVKLAVYRSNAAELAAAGTGGSLNVEFALELNPDQKHAYMESVYLHVNVHREMLTAFEKRKFSEPAQAQLRIRNTWPTPVFEVELFREIDGASLVRDFVRGLLWAANVFVHDHYRNLVLTLHEAHYFDSTNWDAPVAQFFLEHMRAPSCQSVAA